MAKSKRGRKGKSNHKTSSSSGQTKLAASATSIGSFSPRIHPATNDCYPLNKLCRLCLLSNTNMEPIFPYPGDKRLAEKIYQCTSLQVKENSEQGIPTSICGQCKKQLDMCYEFRLLCWKNDEILHNLHAILSPRKMQRPIMHSNLVVQVQKLDLSPSMMKRKEIELRKLTPYTRTPTLPRQRFSIWGYGAGQLANHSGQSLEQLYTPSRRGYQSAKSHPQLSKELVVRLTPISKTLINKYKKVTQTKAAVKSFPIPAKSRGRPKGSVGKPVVKAKTAKAKAEKKTKAEKKPKPAKVQPAAAKKPKPKRVEIAMPPKKRKENFQPTPVTVTCTLCLQTFSNEKNLSRHTATHENSRAQNRVFNCDLCRKEYLKASHLTDHLRSAEHIANAGSNAPENDADVSILPDESGGEMSILPDGADDRPNVPENVCESSQDATEEEEDEVEEIIDQPERPQRSPDTNDSTQNQSNSQTESVLEPEAYLAAAEEATSPNRDASPVLVGDESPREGGVQYSDVCSTNNAENQFNGNGNGTDSSNTSRRVTFSEDITEILD